MAALDSQAAAGTLSRHMTDGIDSERETRNLRMAWIAALSIIAACLATWILLAEPPNPWSLAVQALGFLSIPGKFVIFSGLSSGSPLGPWGLALLGLAADVSLTLTLAVLLAPLGRLRGLGPWLKSAHDRAATTLATYPRLKRMAFWGVALFVFLPLPGTGCIGGTFAGQLLGLTRTATVVAILLASILALIVFAALANYVGAQAQEMIDNPWVVVLSTLAFALFVWLGFRRVRAVLRQN